MNRKIVAVFFAAAILIAPALLAQDAEPATEAAENLDLYGVAELLVREGSEHVGTSLAESRLRERDITVLTLHRGADGHDLVRVNPLVRLATENLLDAFLDRGHAGHTAH